MSRRGLLLLAAMAVWAQSNRETHRAPYQAWRQTAPALEQDAGSPGLNFPGQVLASAQAAQTYFQARESYYRAGPPEAAWVSQPLPRPDRILETPAEIQQLVAVAAARIATNITSFTDDKDPAIRLVRQSMERERAALRALTESMNARKVAVAALTESSELTESQRALVNQAQSAAVARRAQLGDMVKREAAAWAAYYADLGEAAATRTSTGTAPVVVTINGPNTAPVKPPPAKPVVNSLPLSRYVGDWIFPPRGLFYGVQPESVEMNVTENSGILTGTVNARFSGNRTMEVGFQGNMQPARNQRFPLTGGGTIELIPGSAFNLIEVNIQDAPSSTIDSANFILVKR